MSETEAFLLYDAKPKTYREISKFNAVTQNLYLSSLDLKHLLNNECFKQFPCFTREDFYETFLRLEIDSENAYYLAKRIGSGKFSKKDFSDSLFATLPTGLQEITKQCRYVCTRAESVQNVLIYALLAYYQKADSKTYGKIVFSM